MINDKNMDGFIITIYESFLSIDIKTKEKKEDIIFLLRLKDDCKSYQSGFLINLYKSNSNPNSFKLLSQDENFEVLKEYRYKYQKWLMLNKA